MKKFFTFCGITFVVLFIFNISAIAQKYSYDDSWGKAGYTVTQSRTNSVSVNFSINEFTLATQEINRETFHVIELPGNLLPNDEGAPNLPGGGRFIAIPNGAKATLNVRSIRTETFENIDLAPAPRIPLDTERGALEYKKNEKIYNTDAFYPEIPIQISEVTQLRGVDVVTFGITPFQYNPVTKELIVIRDIDVDIVFEGGNGQFGDDKYRSRWFDPILKDQILNSEVLPEVDYNARYRNGSTRDLTGCEYLIVSPDGPEYQQWADSIKVFRTMQGILTKVVTLTEIGGNTATILEDYFDEAYATWDIPPVAVLLLGDYDNGGNMNNSVISPIWDNYCVSDNMFADVNGDHMPEMIFARITANNAGQLEVMVTKFINYERNPPTNPGFYNHPITALGWQTERWFQICSESIGGFFSNVHGKEPVRINAIYDGNPSVDPWSTATNTSAVLNVFGPNGLGYIPATPAELGGWSGGNAAMVNNAINSGSFLLQHRDHGGENGWGEPDYSSSDISGLNNTDLTFIFSINCLTGKYNWNNECFTEKFHRHTSGNQTSGALGLIAASEISYSFVNDTYVWGLFDNMWPEFFPQFGSSITERGLLPSFGNAAGKYFLQQSGWPYNTSSKVVTYNLFHHHGDAFLTLYSEVPEDLTVIHDPVLYSGNSFYNVTADEGSYIALTVNGEIIGVAEGTGIPESITIEPQLPPNKMVVTVTKTNYYRYTQEVEIIPPEGPYVVYNAHEINDSQGNANGEMDYGESILLSMTSRNVGVELAEDVMITIETEDVYVTLTDAEESFGNIEPDGYVTKTDAFALDVSDSIPDGHKVLFNVVSKDVNDSTWISYFTITGRAPVLEIGKMVIDDATGNNNGRLDPGETADIFITTYNIGSSDAYGVSTSLGTSSGFLLINSSSFELGDVGAGSQANSEFNVTVDAGASIGSIVDMIYNVESGLYSLNKTFAAKVGLIVEDWESATFEEFNWNFGGNADWEISESSYEGNYSVTSGNINNNQNSQLLLDYEVMADDSISFFLKVSSEANYDYLEFYIDNAMMDKWAGDVLWQSAAYPVSAGSHTFKWIFDKDGGVSSGADRAWIDFISLPPEMTTTAYAGIDDFVCEGADYLLNGNATLYSSLEWTTSGTGLFDDNTILNPVYTPGDEDIQIGSVKLTLTAYGATRGDATDFMLLTINKAPLVSISDCAYVCEGETYTVSTASVENYTELAWTTSGDGEFDDATALIPIYTPGAADVENGEVNLTITAYQTSCDESSAVLKLLIHPLPVPIISGNTEVCQFGEGYIYSSPDVEGCQYLWEITGGTIVEGQETHEVVVVWEESGEGMLSLTETNVGTECEATVEHIVMISASPQPEINGTALVCKNVEDVIYSTTMVNGNTYEWTIVGGSITTGQNTNEISVTWEETGEGMVEVTETNNETGCHTIVHYDVSVKTLPIVELGENITMCHNHINVIDAGNPDASSWVWSTGETTQTITVDSTGVGFVGSKDISVVVTSTDGCEGSGEIMVTVEDCTGIPENAYDLGINIFPNPNKGVFTLEIETEQQDELNIRVVDARGAVVYSNEQVRVFGNHTMRIDLNDLHEGLYYLIIDSEKVHSVKKVIVKK